MGILDLIRPEKKQAQPAALPADGMAGAAVKLVERLLDVGIDGRGAFDSAAKVAADALAKKGSSDAAMDAVVADHLKLAAAGGFVTGLGGFVTLPVALPANVAGFYVLATRMAGAMAQLRGYDLASPQVRSAILLSLTEADADDILKKAGYASGGKVVSLAAQRLPGPVLMAVNKGVGFRLLTQVGQKTFSRLGRAVPLVGGVLGAGLDGYMIKRIADHVRTQFPQQQGAIGG